MSPVEELKVLCAYVLAVAYSSLPDQLRWELIFNYEVSEHILGRVSLHDIYGVEDKDWESHAEEVREFAAACSKLYDDLEKIGDEGKWYRMSGLQR